jgi:hypothetical protein
MVRAQMGAYAGQKLFPELLRLAERPLGHQMLVVQNFSAHDLVDPFLIHLQRPQHIGEFIDVAASAVITR